jgi:hypothetical protein
LLADIEWILGHDGGIPSLAPRSTPAGALFALRSDNAEIIGSQVQFCKNGNGNRLLSLELAYTPRANGAEPNNKLASYCLLGGSGGLPGGSIRDGSFFAPEDQLKFLSAGTAGLFGASGKGGQSALLSIPSSNNKNGKCAIGFSEFGLILPDPVP